MCTERAELEALRAQQLVCGSEDVGFLRYLAASYLSRGLHQQALQCLQRLTMLSPGVTRGALFGSQKGVRFLLSMYQWLWPTHRGRAWGCY
jgi:hypothetical protein